mmetsp:Transcript_16586/g.29023  ORF Transcript_16586/g.29023 Transcript_16586/m.29023 type:complete len:208 (-) Transcript_16586:84-707(-)
MASCFSCCGACFGGAIVAGFGLRQLDNLQPERPKPEKPKETSASPVPVEATAAPPAAPPPASVSSSAPVKPAPKKDQSRVLYDAAWNSDFEEAFNAIEAGADPMARFGVRKITSLHVAARTGNTKILGMLLHYEKAPKVDLEARNKDGETPLFGAVLEGHVGTTQALVDARADVNAKDNEGATVLSIAKEKGKQDFVDFLKSSGATE